MDRAEDFRFTSRGNSTFAQRSQTIERVFAYARERHGQRYTTWRGRARMEMEVLLTFTCMNMKKLAKWKVKDPGFRKI